MSINYYNILTGESYGSVMPSGFKVVKNLSDLSEEQLDTYLKNHATELPTTYVYGDNYNREPVLTDANIKYIGDLKEADDFVRRGWGPLLQAKLAGIIGAGAATATLASVFPQLYPLLARTIVGTTAGSMAAGETADLVSKGITGRTLGENARNAISDFTGFNGFENLYLNDLYIAGTDMASNPFYFVNPYKFWMPVFNAGERLINRAGNSFLNFLDNVLIGNWRYRLPTGEGIYLRLGNKGIIDDAINKGAIMPADDLQEGIWHINEWKNFSSKAGDKYDLAYQKGIKWLEDNPNATGIELLEYLEEIAPKIDPVKSFSKNYMFNYRAPFYGLGSRYKYTIVGSDRPEISWRKVNHKGHLGIREPYVPGAENTMGVPTEYMDGYYTLLPFGMGEWFRKFPSVKAPGEYYKSTSQTPILTDIQVNIPYSINTNNSSTFNIEEFKGTPWERKMREVYNRQVSGNPRPEDSVIIRKGLEWLDKYKYEQQGNIKNLVSLQSILDEVNNFLNSSLYLDRLNKALSGDYLSPLDKFILELGTIPLDKGFVVTGKEAETLGAKTLGQYNPSKDEILLRPINSANLDMYNPNVAWHEVFHSREGGVNRFYGDVIHKWNRLFTPELTEYGLNLTKRVLNGKPYYLDEYEFGERAARTLDYALKHNLTYDDLYNIINVDDAPIPYDLPSDVEEFMKVYTKDSGKRLFDNFLSVFPYIIGGGIGTNLLLSNGTSGNLAL